MKKYYRIQIAQFRVNLQTVILYPIQLECGSLDFHLVLLVDMMLVDRRAKLIITVFKCINFYIPFC
jgi:hypothetical protein